MFGLKLGRFEKEGRIESLWSVRRPLIKLSSICICVCVRVCSFARVCMLLPDKLIAPWSVEITPSNGSETSSQLAHITTGSGTALHLHISPHQTYYSPPSALFYPPLSVHTPTCGATTHLWFLSLLTRARG